jgi:hypothetical protein
MIKLKNLLEVTSNPTQQVKLKIAKDEDSLYADLYLNDTKIGTIEAQTEDQKTYAILNSEILAAYRKKGYYKQALLRLLDKYPTIKLVSYDRSEDANKAWEALIRDMPKGYGVERKDNQIILSKK